MLPLEGLVAKRCGSLSLSGSARSSSMLLFLRIELNIGAIAGGTLPVSGVLMPAWDGTMWTIDYDMDC